MSQSKSSVVTVGVDAAIVSDHQVAVRGDGIREDFRVSPTLAGMRKLTERLAPYAGALVIAEPTGGTWIPLSWAVADAGCRLGLVQNRDSARLREAISGRNKTDIIDAEMLAGCERVLGVEAAQLPSPGQIGVRRALRRRHQLTVAAHRAECRLWGLSAWLFPDVWRACGGHRLAQPLLGRWPHLGALARAHVASITDIVADYTRDQEPSCRAERIHQAAVGWQRFWDGRLDLDAFGWEVSELCADIAIADQFADAAGEQAFRLWNRHWPNDVLCTIPGVGRVTAASTRAWWGDGTWLPSAKAASSFVGLNPSNWESGLMTSPSRPITKEGPPELRLAYYQAANLARRHDPDLAFFYRRLMVERNHNHISASCAVARKLAARAWAVLQSGQPYQLRDLDGNPIDWDTATAIAATFTVPEATRRRNRGHHRPRGRLSH